MRFELSRRRLSPWMTYGYHGEKSPAYEYRGHVEIDPQVHCDIKAVRSDTGKLLKLEINSHGIPIDSEVLKSALLNHISFMDRDTSVKPLEEIATEARALPVGRRLLTGVVSRVKELLGYK